MAVTRGMLVVKNPNIASKNTSSGLFSALKPHTANAKVTKPQGTTLTREQVRKNSVVLKTKKMRAKAAKLKVTTTPAVKKPKGRRTPAIRKPIPLRKPVIKEDTLSLERRRKEIARLQGRIGRLPPLKPIRSSTKRSFGCRDVTRIEKKYQRERYQRKKSMIALREHLIQEQCKEACTNIITKIREKLPAELRDQIYGYLCGDNGISSIEYSAKSGVKCIGRDFVRNKLPFYARADYVGEDVAADVEVAMHKAAKYIIASPQDIESFLGLDWKPAKHAHHMKLQFHDYKPLGPGVTYYLRKLAQLVNKQTKFEMVITTHESVSQNHEAQFQHVKSVFETLRPIWDELKTKGFSRISVWHYHNNGATLKPLTDMMKKPVAEVEEWLRSKY